MILTCMEDLADNDGLPEDRIEKAWSLLPGAPKWNRDHYAIVRDHLEKRGVVDIYDKDHRPNKCWRWRKGKSYPLSPDEVKAKLKRIQSCGIGILVSASHRCNTYEITPYYEVVGVRRVLCLLNGQMVRPPPLLRLHSPENRLQQRPISNSHREEWGRSATTQRLRPCLYAQSKICTDEEKISDDEA